MFPIEHCFVLSVAPGIGAIGPIANGASLAAKCFHRINLRRSPSRNPASEQCDSRKESRHYAERQRVELADINQHGSQQSGYRSAATQT
jgi:hypothetical protein